MDKLALTQLVLERLSNQLETMRKAARSAHDAATGDEAKAEGKYDTRGLEASYLAQAQAEQCQKLERSIQLLNSFSPSDSMTVESGSIVETEKNGEITYYFLLPCAGGLNLSHSGLTFTTLAPDAPLYDSLLGYSTGDIIDSHNIMLLDVI